MLGTLFFWASCERSNLRHQIAETHFQGFGDSDQRMNAHRLFAALDLAEIDGMQLGFFRQFFLADADCIPMFSDGCADEFSMPRFVCHSRSGKQQPSGENTVHTLLSFCLRI